MKLLKADRIPDGIEKALALVITAYVFKLISFLIHYRLYFETYEVFVEYGLFTWFFSWTHLSLILFIYLIKRSQNEIYYFASFLTIIYFNYLTVVSLPNYFDIKPWNVTYSTIIDPEGIKFYLFLRVILGLIYLLIPYFLLQKDTRDWIFKKE